VKKKASEVFIAGGQPSITYNPRKKYKLEEQLIEYLDTGYKLLSISGPTKSGKTVLCRKIIPTSKGIWIPGGQIQTETDFWTTVLDKLGTPINYTIESGSENSRTIAGQFDGGINFGIASSKGHISRSKTGKTTQKISEQFVRNPRIFAIQQLLEAKVPLVIDDFHYIPREVQSSIVRALKDPIFEGLRVVIIAVPHRAYDAVRVEKEMTGRVTQLQIPLWTPDELKEIPQKGFPELNAHCPEATIERFTRESFGSPHLIQEFCLRLCYDNDLREQSDNLTFILEPGDYAQFFKRIALSASKLAFERLASGPRPRTDRIIRDFSDGSKGDIYVAILKALAQTGPKTEIQYEEIRAGLRNVLVGQLPKANEVTRVLGKMSEIAREQKDGEPVLEWVNNTLYIADPFFAFYLKWNS